MEVLQCIKNNYPKYIITLDYDTNSFEWIKLIGVIDYLLGKVNLFGLLITNLLKVSFFVTKYENSNIYLEKYFIILYSINIW